MFINRDYARTENDDYTLNVQPQVREYKEAVPQYYEQKLIGWIVQNQYE